MTRVEEIRQSYANLGRLRKAEVLYLLEMADRGENTPTVAAIMPTEQLPKCPEKDVYEGLDNEQVITLSTSLVVMMLMILERSLPAHSVIARREKIPAITHALLDLVKGAGDALDAETITYWERVWNRFWNLAMLQIKTEYELEDAKK